MKDRILRLDMVTAVENWERGDNVSNVHEMKDWTFESGGGEVREDGKSHHPDMVRVQLRKREVVELLRRVTSHLDYPDGEPFPLELVVIGQLRPTEGEGAGDLDTALAAAVDALKTLGKQAADAGKKSLAQRTAIAFRTMEGAMMERTAKGGGSAS